MIRFSIIIPHKNIPDLLQRMLDSIPKRNDVQVIIVDDNSDPSIVDFEHFPGLNNPNTEVYFTKEGKGAGYARNVGLKHAKGEWLLFADADDMYITENLSYLFDFINSDLDLDYDAIYYGELSVVMNGERKIETFGYILQNHIVDMIDKEKFLIEYHQPWRKIVRHKLLTKYNILFEETMRNNDVMFSIKQLHYSNKVGMLAIPIYSYIRRSSSLSLNFTPQSISIAFDIAVRANKFLKTNGYNLICPMTSRYMSQVRNKSMLYYFYFLIKEAVIIDVKTALDDYKKSCRALGVAINPIKLLTDSVRVLLGALYQKLISSH